MKNYLQIWMLLLCVVGLFSACGKDDEVVIDEEWKAKNEKVLEGLVFDGYTELSGTTTGGSGSIYYKVLKEGTGTERIYYNSTVSAYYTGWLVDDDKTKFDSTEPPLQTPYSFTLNQRVVSGEGVIAGWTLAIQHMHVGDRWEIYIPQELGYGASGSRDGSIPPYSTLKFEVEVVEIIEQ